MSVSTAAAPAAALTHPTELFIDGGWRRSTGTESFTVVNPSDGSQVITVPAATEQDMDAAVEAARRDFGSGPWPRLTPGERAGYPRAIASEIRRRGDTLAQFWTKSTAFQARPQTSPMRSPVAIRKLTRSGKSRAMARSSWVRAARNWRSSSSVSIGIG